MTSNLALEQAIDKIILKTEQRTISDLNDTLSDSKQEISDSLSRLDQEYDKIISDGHKEATKIEKQIIGSSDLGSRNKELLVLEEAVDRVFVKAIEQIAKEDHSVLIKVLLEESTRILHTTNVVVFTNAKDRGIVKASLSKFSGAELSPDNIDCLGGIVVKSKDGIMTFDNTLDARIERMKPLIRKEIATKFGVKN